MNARISGTWLGQVSVLLSTPPEGSAWDGLDADERQRMRSFRNPAAARAWAGSRLLLRQQLAGELRTHPGLLRYRRLPCTACGSETHGKPVIAGPAGPTVQFSLSRTTGLVGIAMAHSLQVGIDVETRRSLNPQALLEAAFSEEERRSVLAVAGDRARTSAILRSITRKEAIVKALGAHLGLYPRSIPSSPHTTGAYTALVPLRGARIQVRVESREADGIHCSVAAIDGRFKNPSSAP